MRYIQIMILVEVLLFMVSVIPYFHTPVGRTSHEYFVMERVPHHFVHPHVMSLHCIQVLGGESLATSANLSILRAHQVQVVQVSVESHRCPGLCKTTKSTLYFTRYRHTKRHAKLGIQNVRGCTKTTN